jgi:transcriptional regulator with XRE-family HTH domain
MLGENLKTARNQKHFTQEELGNMIGVSRVCMAYFENGTRVPSVAILKELADILDVSTDWLLDRKEYSNG